LAAPPGSPFAPTTPPVPFDGILEIPSREYYAYTRAQFPAHAWSPALRAQLALAEFAQTDWQKIEQDDSFGPLDLTKAEAVQSALHHLLRKRDEQRATRTVEISVQDQNPQAYWWHVLSLDLRTKYYTAVLIEIGMAVGTLVAMRMKWKAKSPRPSQLLPALVPAIPVPPHPSYPSGHSLQSHLIKHILNDGLGFGDKHPMRAPVRALAVRIADNREIAGVHFQEDTLGGKRYAELAFANLAECSEFKGVVAEARREWDFSDGTQIEPTEVSERESRAPRPEH